MRIAIFGVDSGDQADAVYDYVQPRQNERVFATKGREHLSRPGLAVEGTAKRSHIRLFQFATVAAKDRIISRLQIEQPGPGYIHLPMWVPEQYLDQMTSEKKLTKKDPRRGTIKMEYVTTGRNEAFDLEVYSLGLLFVLQTFINPNLYRDLGRLHQMITSGTPLASQGRQRGVRSAGIPT
jgi:phage terminase large subunit GpA-like protein